MPPDIKTYQCKPDQCKLFKTLFDLQAGELKGLETTLAFIMIRGDENEVFFSYGYDKNNNDALCCTAKNRILNVFVGTAFERHTAEITNMSRRAPFLKLFFYLPLTIDLIEKNQLVLKKFQS